MNLCSVSTSIMACLSLASCSIAPQAVVRNAGSSDLTLWPLSARPILVKSGETTPPIIYTAHERQEALIKRDNCIYTYAAPDYFQLPKQAKGYASRVVVVVDQNMTLHLHARSKEGVEGLEIVAAGFPLKPVAFCERESTAPE